MSRGSAATWRPTRVVRPGSRAPGDGAASGAELCEGRQARLQLLLAGLRGRRATAAATQLGVDLGMGPPAACSMRGDEPAQLLAQRRHPFVRRHLEILGNRGRCTTRALGLFGLPLAQQGGDLVRLEQTGQPQEVLLVLAARFGVRPELVAVVEDAVERRRRLERLEAGTVVEVSAVT